MNPRPLSPLQSLALPRPFPRQRDNEVAHRSRCKARKIRGHISPVLEVGNRACSHIVEDRSCDKLHDNVEVDGGRT